MPKKPWWNSKYGKNSICAITHNRLRPGYNKYGQKRSVFLKCKHGFSRQALETWILTNTYTNPKCPLCRNNFDISVVFRTENISPNKCTVEITA